MPTIKVKVENKIATAEQDAFIVCGNSDYIIDFEFDELWANETIKTARFYYNFGFTDVVFEGNTCQVPILGETQSVKIGVFTNNVKTSTPAEIKCKYSIKKYGGIVIAPTKDVYAQIMELLNKYIEQSGGSSNINREEVEQIIQEYLTQNPVKDGFSPTVEITELENGHRVTITDINGEKSFNVFNGKDGESSSGGGKGTVTAVNGVEPDEYGNVEIGADDVGATPYEPINGIPLLNGENKVDNTYLQNENYELIEKIIIGYSITTAQPDDWATNYTAYFTNTGTEIEPVYTAVTGDTVPTWQHETYYSYSDVGSVLSIRVEPDGTPYDFKNAIVMHQISDKATRSGYLYNNFMDTKSPYMIFQSASSSNAIRVGSKSYIVTRLEKIGDGLYSYTTSESQWGFSSLGNVNVGVIRTYLSSTTPITKDTHIRSIITGHELPPQSTVWIYAVRN